MQEKPRHLTRRDALRTLALAAGAAAIPGALGIARARAASPSPTATPAATPPPVVSTALGDKLNVISGLGGNIAVLAGADGAFVVDSGLVDRLAKTQSELGKAAPLALLVNTHWHFDHVGGNEAIAGAGARIIAHENCRQRLATEQYAEAFDRKIPASPRAALPVITLTEPTTLHLNDEEIRLLPVLPAHTDGDVIVHFQKTDVIHTGDLYFNGGYPFIDYSSRGVLGGLVTAIRGLTAVAGAQTSIIPGHGPVATRDELKNYLAFLETMLERFGKLKAEGKSVEEVVAAAPTKDFDEKLGRTFLKPDQFVRITYTGMLR
jgi:glyoxylase-like metal-dependent hydrolase (beta-lactamase superfamily II)